MTKDVEEVKAIIDENKKEIAFLVGNGINIYNSSGKTNNWLSLLENLWNGYTCLNTGNGKLPFPEGVGRIDIGYTEVYDVIKTHLKPEYRDQQDVILEKTIDQLGEWKPGEHHKKIAGKIQELDVPLLTTNFDNTLPVAIGAKFFKRPQGSKGFSHYYPWECYYSTGEVTNNRESMAIWNIHGTIRYKKSIKLGLADYMGMVHRAKEIISKDLYCYNSRKDGFKWSGAGTWLNIFFYASLFIFGIGLTREEIFLRWLLNERSKFHSCLKERHEIERKTWYVHVEEEGKMDYGKYLFLKSLHIKILTLPTYKDLYEGLWS